MNKKILGLALVATFSTGVNAATMEFDSFNGVAYAASATLAGAGAGLSSGGYARTVDATSSGIDTDVSLNSGASLGLYAHSQSAGVTGYSQINYSLGGGLDLSNGANAFSIGIESADLNGLFGVIVNGVSFDFGTTALFLASGGVIPATAEFLFSDFGGVDFSNVNTISLFVDGSSTPALDMSIDNFGTSCTAATVSGLAGAAGNCVPPVGNVPEPASIALLGLGLGLMGFARRNKKA